MKIKFKDTVTGRWVTQQVVEVQDLRPTFDIVRFVTDKGHRVRREDCIEGGLDPEPSR